MNTVKTMPNAQAQDADAAYILNKIASADRLEAESKVEEQSATDKRRAALDDRIAAGLRLIEVMSRLKDAGLSFSDWFSRQPFNFTERTAYNLMKLAGSTDEEREATKAKEAQRKREDRAAKKEERTDLGWVTVLKNALGNIPGCKNKKAEYEEKMGESIPAYFKSLEDGNAFVERFIRLVGLPEATQREQLPKSAEEKLQRAIRIETAKLNMSYHVEVEKGVEAKLADRIAHLDQLRDKVAEKEKRYDMLIAGIKPIISRDEYRFLLNTVHSDRVPSPEKLDKAFIIIKKLEPYINSSAE